MEEAVVANLSKVKVVNETCSVESGCRTSVNSQCCTCQTEAGETTPLLKHCNEHSVEKNANICSDQETPTRKTMTKRQIAMLILISYGHFWISTCYSLLAPFFPAEAEKKGASPTIYGLIFGVFQLILFITGPIYGKIIPVATPRFLIISGMFVSSSCSVLFGSLYYSSAGLPFIILAFAVRIVEGLGTSAYVVAALTALSSEFPENKATVLSLIESVGGIGMIVGPTVGGALYQASNGTSNSLRSDTSQIASPFRMLERVYLVWLPKRH